MSEAEPIIRTFEMLSIPEKVKAVLGVVREPVTKQLAIEFSSINPQELDEQVRSKVEEVFSGDDVVKTQVKGEERFWLTDEAKQKLGESVDLWSVDGHITEVMLNKVNLHLKNTLT